MSPESDLPTRAGVLALAVACCLTIVGCATVAPAAPAAAPAAQAKAQPAPAAPAAAAAEDPLPDVDLNSGLLYRIMAAEVAVQRGELGTAYATYMSVARESRDPRLARRATELALQGRALAQAIDGALLWRQLAPQSREATQTLAVLFMTAGRFDEATPLLQDQIARSARPAADLAQLQQQIVRLPDRVAGFNLLDRLAQPFLADADVRLTLAQGAAAAGLAPRAAAEARAALAAAPDSERAAITVASLMQRDDRAGAIALVAGFLKRKPDANAVRLAYARLLVIDGRYDESRQQFEELLRRDARNPDTLYALGVLAIQGRHPAQARDYLTRYLALLDETGSTDRDPDPAYLQLAQLAEDARNYPEALDWLGRVDSGEQYLLARIREAGVLLKMNRLEDGRKVLRDASVQNAQQRTQLLVAEAQLLREAQRPREAYDLLAAALEKSADDQALMYDTAMAAERIDRLDVMESLLRKLIALRPDHAHAHNALGYSLADRNQRLPEALALIEKAHELSPGDAFIVDSLGWVHYRMGNLVKARQYLEQAWNAQPEAEVGIHLAEVMWMQGEHDAARKLLRQVSTMEPDSALLKSTLARLKIRL